MGARDDLDEKLRRLLVAQIERVASVHFDRKGRLRRVELVTPTARPLPPTRPLAPPADPLPPSTSSVAPTPSLDPAHDDDDDRFASSSMRPDRRRG